MSFNRPLKTNGRESLKAVYTLYGKLLQIECVCERDECAYCVLLKSTCVCLSPLLVASFSCIPDAEILLFWQSGLISQMIHFLGCWPTKGPESTKIHRTELVKLKLTRNFMCLMATKVILYKLLVSGLICWSTKFGRIDIWRISAPFLL